MHADEFIAFASSIAARNSANAVAYRSSVSRAYYGAYHLSVRFVEQWFYCKTDNQHLWVQRHFYNCKHPVAHAVGVALGNLHESRKDADYELDDGNQDTQSAALACVGRADEIRKQLLLCASDANQIQAEMQTYRNRANVR
jgi:hypothetical protein